MKDIIVIAHNIRSAHNVGSLFRTCEGFGISKLLLTGYTPYPRVPHDERLPHVVDKLTAQLHKTALGAETLLPFEHHDKPPLETLRSAGYLIIGLEQDEDAVMLNTYHAPKRLAVLIGEEVQGLDPSLRKMCDHLVEIPMSGQKESFNVSVATGIALYGLLYNR